MTDTLRDKLFDFGLSANQTKIYYAVALSRCSTIGQISEATNIHVQDIYKILLVLQKKGLLIRTFNRPITVEATPIEKALKHMLNAEKEKSEQRLQRLNKTSTDIIEIFEAAKKNKGYALSKAVSSKDVKVFVLDSIDVALAKSKIETTFENLEQYDLITPTFPYFEPMSPGLKVAGKHGAKIRILIITGRRQTDIRYIQHMKSVLLPICEIELRTIEIKEELRFAIIDSKEVWFRLCPITEKPENSSVLVTDSRGIVELAKREFERLWKDAKAEATMPSSSKNQRLTTVT